MTFSYTGIAIGGMCTAEMNVAPKVGVGPQERLIVAIDNHRKDGPIIGIWSGSGGHERRRAWGIILLKI
jgi:hypothetical protein